MKHVEFKDRIESFGTSTLVQPRFRDFDLQGVLNSAAYMELVGEARVEQMARHYRIPIEVYVAKNQSWLTASFEIQYLKPIIYNSNFFVSTTTEVISGSLAVVRFMFQSTNLKTIFSKGCVHYHLFDLASRKLVDIPVDHANVYLEKVSLQGEK